MKTKKYVVFLYLSIFSLDIIYSSKAKNEKFNNEKAFGSDSEHMRQLLSEILLGSLKWLWYITF